MEPKQSLNVLAFRSKKGLIFGRNSCKPYKNGFITIMQPKGTKKDYAIGIDVGGTNTVFGMVDHRGDIRYRGAKIGRAHV